MDGLQDEAKSEDGEVPPVSEHDEPGQIEREQTEPQRTKPEQIEQCQISQDQNQDNPKDVDMEVDSPFEGDAPQSTNET